MDTPQEPSKRTRRSKTLIMARRLQLWARRTDLGRKLTYVLVVLAAMSGIATVYSTTGSGYGFGQYDLKLVVGLLYLDAALLLILGVVIVRRFTTVWLSWRRGVAGSKLHTRMILLFSTVAVAPAVLVAIFATIFLNFGMQAWFSERVRTAVNESGAVALAYFAEHQQNIRVDIFEVATTINRNATKVTQSRWEMERLLNLTTVLRGLDEAVILDLQRNVLASAGDVLTFDYSDVPDLAFERAQMNEVHIIAGSQEDRVRALVRLENFADAYLLVGRYVEQQVLAHVERTRRAVEQYRSLESRSQGIQISFVMIFAMVALLLLMASASLGLIVSNRLMRPIASLIGAANKVGQGDLRARAEGGHTSDELGLLIRSFNHMASQLSTQREGLVMANRELDERRRFIEAVLGGVSAGVIGLDTQGRLTLANRSASHLLEINLVDRYDDVLIDVIPELKTLYDAATRHQARRDPVEVRIATRKGERTLMVSITSEDIGEEVVGYVVTFDDVTDLVDAQRKAAWADIARRIAHEIKNPLTPIQLAADRLQRKYSREITKDPEVFETCTKTIIRHVEDIGRMVDEFRDFARMPRAVMAVENISELCRQTVFLETNRTPNVDLSLDLPDTDLMHICDGRQIGRALTNVVKNAIESVIGTGEAPISGGKVSVVLRNDADQLRVIVEDNGPGFPTEFRHRLTEPYVTTRSKGTGLGLAIVKKIMEDHDGKLILGDSPSGGASVQLVFADTTDATTKKEPGVTPQDQTTRLTTDGA